MERNVEIVGENSVPVPIRQPQIPYGLAWDRNRVSVERVRRLASHPVDPQERVCSPFLTSPNGG
jgi:hypothetical protein